MMKGFATRHTGKIMLLIQLFLAVGMTVHAQEYENAPVEISEQKVKIDGKVYYSHIVLEKQTLYSISKAYNVSIEDIYAANPGLKKNGLKKNSIINIPIIKKSGPSVQKIHIVKWYEDITTIAAKYGISEEMLIAANNLKDGKLKSRQKLIIPGPGFEYTVDETQIAQNKTEIANTDSISTTSLIAGEEPKTELIANMPTDRKVNAMVLLPLKATGTSSSKSNMDFYSGVILAVRELGEAGVKIELNVHDIANGSFGATKQELINSDIIIGPVSAGDITRLYAIASSIKALISPLDPRAESLIDTYPTMIHAPASRASQYADVAKWLGEDMLEGDRIIIISEKGARVGDEGKLMQAAVDSAKLAYTPFSYSILEGRDIQEPLEAIMVKENGVNRILIASESEAFVNDVVRNLNLIIHNKHQIALYGPAKIRTFDTIEIDNFHNTSLHASLTYHIDYESAEVKSFLKKYRALFNTEPTQFAFQGYDVAKYFIGLCAYYGEDWMSKMPECSKQMLQSYFHMNPKAYGGFSNTGIRRISYGQEYKVNTLY